MPILKRTSIAPLTFVAVLSVPLLARGDSPWISGVGDLDGGSIASFAYGVSDDGAHVVGSSSSQGRYQNEGFIWTRDAGIKGIGDMNGGKQIGSDLMAITDGGHFGCGASQNDDSEWGEAVRWSPDDGFLGLGDLPGNEYFSAASALSEDGNVIVGISTSERTDGGDYEAFRWTPEGGMTDLGDFPGGTYAHKANSISADGRIITGDGLGPNGGEAFYWTEETGIVGIGQITKGIPSTPYGMSTDGRFIVGEASTRDKKGTAGQAFLWSEESGMRGLGYLHGIIRQSFANGVSDDGQTVIGTSFTTNDGELAFIWDEQHGMRDLRRVLMDEYGLKEAKGWQLDVASDISADGRTIVGYGMNSRGDHEGWVVHIPEPSTAALALALLVLIRRREEPTSARLSRRRRIIGNVRALHLEPIP